MPTVQQPWWYASGSLRFPTPSNEPDDPSVHGSKTLPVDALPMPIDTFVKTLTSLTSSLIIAHSMSPDDFDEAVIVSAFEGLAGPAPLPTGR